MARRTKSSPDTPSPEFVSILRPAFDLAASARAREGDAEALFEMGRLFFEGRRATHAVTRSRDAVLTSCSPGVPRDPTEAARLLQQAADQGHDEARRLLEVVRLEIEPGIH